MFLKILILSALVTAVLSTAAQEPVQIISQDFHVEPDGSFQWRYESADGTAQQQSGHLIGVDDEDGEAIEGSASWTDPEGGHHHLSYTADENGYHPHSADIPQAPEIPAAIQRSLEWNAAHPEE